MLPDAAFLVSSQQECSLFKLLVHFYPLINLGVRLDQRFVFVVFSSLIRFRCIVSFAVVIL